MTTIAKHDKVFRLTGTAAFNRDYVMHDQMLSCTASVTDAPMPDLIDKKEYDKIERKRRVRNERTKT